MNKIDNEDIFTYNNISRCPACGAENCFIKGRDKKVQK